MTRITGNTSDAKPFTGWKDKAYATVGILQCRACKNRWVGDPRCDGSAKYCPECNAKHGHHILFEHETEISIMESEDPVENPEQHYRTYRCGSGGCIFCEEETIRSV